MKVSFAFISFLFISFSKCDIPRVRGVSISKASLYPPGEHFTCLDGSKKIKFVQVSLLNLKTRATSLTPLALVFFYLFANTLFLFTQVNDDFCDCPDYSDEPGTSACPGSFHCTNLHHRPKNIVSNRVNDGICDCCDGSDEYSSTSGVKCENTCLEMGREEREKTKARQELLKKGGLVKNEMIMRGKALKLERAAKVLELEKRKSEADAIKDEKDKIKREIESLEFDALAVYREMEEKEKAKQEEASNLEAENTFSSFDSNLDGVVDIPEIQAHLAFDKDKDGVVSDEEALYFLDSHETVDLENFKTNSWPKIKSQFMVNEGVFTSPDEEHETETEPEHEEDREHEEEEDEDETGEGDVEEQQREPESHREEVQYDSHTQQLIDQANQARNELSEAERIIREIDNEIKDLKDVESREYGPSEEFSPLAGECFEYEDREYVYKLCPFERASQQPKNGGSETR